MHNWPMLRLILGRLGRFSAVNYYKMMGTSEIIMSYKLNLATVDTLFYSTCQCGIVIKSHIFIREYNIFCFKIL